MPKKKKKPKYLFRKKKSTIDRYVNFYEKIVKSGKNISQIKRMNVKQYNKTFNTHVRTKKSLEAQKNSLLKQVERDLDKITSIYLERQGITGKGLKKAYYKEAREQFNFKDEEKKQLIENLDVIKSKPISKKGKYGILKLTDLKTDEKYYFKYKNEKKLKMEVNKRIAQYKISSYVTEITGIYMYKAYITEQFKKEMRA